MTLEDLNGILRAQAWERANGELQSILVSYMNDEARFEAMSAAVSKFAREVEGNGWAE